MDFFEKYSPTFYTDQMMPFWYTPMIYVGFLSVICSYCYLYTENNNKFEDFAERVDYLRTILWNKKNKQDSC